MYRIKYLFGIFSAVFGLVYLLFGIVGYEDARTFMDRYTSFVLCFLHLLAAAALSLSSFRDKREHDKRLREIINSLLLIHPSVTAELLAKEADMTLPDAHEYIARTMKHS